MTGEPLFLVYSTPTEEYALPGRTGWTKCREEAGRYSAWGADRACEIMVGGAQFALSIVPAEDLESG